MQFSTILAILAPLAAVQAAAIKASPALGRRGCYQSVGAGSQWFGDEASKNVARNIVDKICNAEGVSGWFVAGQKKTHCEPASDTTTFGFAVTWTGSEAPAGPLNDEDCKLRLKNEINGCDAGGESTTAGWTFK
jgi:hypothetical protein